MTSPPSAAAPSTATSSPADPDSAAETPADATPPDAAAAPPADPVTRIPGPAAPTAVPNLSSGTSTAEGPASAPAAPIPDRYSCHGSVPCRRLLALGTVTGALGLAGVATGVALALRPVQVDPDDPTTAITYRPAGTAVLTIGVGVVVTSLLMILTANRASRRALQKRTHHARLAP